VNLLAGSAPGRLLHRFRRSLSQRELRAFIAAKLNRCLRCSTERVIASPFLAGDWGLWFDDVEPRDRDCRCQVAEEIWTDLSCREFPCGMAMASTCPVPRRPPIVSILWMWSCGV